MPLASAFAASSPGVVQLRGWLGTLCRAWLSPMATALAPGRRLWCGMEASGAVEDACSADGEQRKEACFTCRDRSAGPNWVWTAAGSHQGQDGVIQGLGNMSVSLHEAQFVPIHVCIQLYCISFLLVATKCTVYKAATSPGLEPIYFRWRAITTTYHNQS